MTLFLTKKELFKILLDGRSFNYLKNTDSRNLHYLQLILFKPWMAKISITVYVALTTLPLWLISIFWLKIVVFLFLAYFDFKYRKIFISVFKNNLCLYEILASDE